MKANLQPLIWVGAGWLVSVSSAIAAPMGTATTYQGLLEDAGASVTGQVDMIFTLYDAATLGNVVGTAVLFDGQAGNGPPVDVNDGLFTVAPDFGANVFDGTALFLEIQVRNPHDATDMAMYTTLNPRQPITAAPVALQTRGIFVEEPSGNVGIGTALPSEKLTVAGDIHASGTIASGNSITIDGAAGSEKIVSTGALELHTSIGRGWRMEPAQDSPNIIGGIEFNSVAAGVAGATIAGGGTGFDPNRIFDDHGTIAGGKFNKVGLDDGSPIGDPSATVGGGFSNTASRAHSTVGGGDRNSASGDSSTVGGGRRNIASGDSSTVGGGDNNRALETNATVGGGLQNFAASGDSTVAGGRANCALDDTATVGGGSGNDAEGAASTIGGGGANTASGNNSTVGGGIANTASGFASTVPGGVSNEAAGNASFAAGNIAQAMHDGSFVWADSNNHSPVPFTSTGLDQFLVRAAGGVGINTNNPQSALHVGGTPGVDGIRFPDGSLQTSAFPIGGVIDWWRPDGTFPVPAGHLICDGSLISDPQSPYDGATLPDLRNKFVRGAQSVAEIGETGGTTNHNHAIDHNHPAVSTDNSGGHVHLWANYDSTNRIWTAWDSGGGSFTVMDWGDGMDSGGSGHYPLSCQDTGRGLWTNPSDSFNGKHTHMVDVPPLTETSGDKDHLPPYVGLLKIMRIK